VKRICRSFLRESRCPEISNHRTLGLQYFSRV
jgi:hypothetical protein